MAHGEASGGPVLPPQRRSLQQRFGPHARARDGRGTVRRLLALYARWGRELLLVVCLTLLSTGAALAVPYLLGRAVDCFLPWGGVERAALSVLLPTLAGAAAAQWLGNWGRRRWMEILSQRMVARIRRECFAKLGRLPLSYFDRHPHGDTMNRLVSDADNVSTVAAETVTQLLSSLLMVAGALAIMAALSPLLTLTALATVPVIALCTRLISRRSRGYCRSRALERTFIASHHKRAIFRRPYVLENQKDDPSGTAFFPYAEVQRNGHVLGQIHPGACRQDWIWSAARLI